MWMGVKADFRIGIELRTESQSLWFIFDCHKKFHIPCHAKLIYTYATKQNVISLLISNSYSLIN